MRNFFRWSFATVVLFSACINESLIDSSTYVCKPPNELVETFGEPNQSCTAMPTDYVQDVSKRTAAIEGTSTPLWPACVMDSETHWKKVAPSRTPDALQRTSNFDAIRGLLEYTNAAAPSAKDFSDAKTLYAQAGGIESQLNISTDYHLTLYPPSGQNGLDAIDENGPCAQTPIQSECLSACVGPVTLAPAINDAFAKATREPQVLPRTQAAKIEAALIWFFYDSIYSELHTGRNQPQDIDNMWASYTGDGGSGSAKGLASYLQTLSPATHARVWDGMRAMRCWRSYVGDDKSVTGEVQDTDDDIRWKTARNQLDRATLQGISLIVRDRIEKLTKETNSEIKSAHWAFLQTLTPVLDRAARSTDNSTEADLVQATLAKTDVASLSVTDLNAMSQAIAITFPCP